MKPISWSLVLACLLGIPLLSCSAARAQQAVDLKKLTIDAKITNTPQSGILLLKVRPVKLFNWQGEPLTGYAEVLNNTATKHSVVVQAQLTNDIDQLVGLQQQKVELAPYTRQQVSFTWAPKLLKPYGHALRVDLLENGKSLARGEEYFGSAAVMWDIAICGSHPIVTAQSKYTAADVERAVDYFRDSYINMYEKFFWAPDDFGNMTPTKASWYSGQTRYHEQMDLFKHLIAYGNQTGVLPTTYGKSVGGGSAARDLLLKHPEFIYGYGHTMHYSPDTEGLAKFDQDSAKPWGEWYEASYNMNDPAVVQYGIEQIANSTKQFGWAAVRFDGHFAAQTGKQRVGDKEIDFTYDMADKQTAANQKALKEYMRKIAPRYGFGYNYVQGCAFDKQLETQTRESLELCRDGGEIMDESSSENNDSAHPWNHWDVYALGMVKETEQIRRLGGYLCSIVGGNLYPTIITYAAGAHPYYPQPGPYLKFATRYSALLWDKNIKNVWNPNGLVIAPSSVMWENFVREQDIDARHKRLIIHLINPPAQATAYETLTTAQEIDRRAKRRQEIQATAAEKKVAPDYTEIDQLPPLKLYPDPQKDLSVKIAPQALDGHWTPTRVLLCDPETTTHRALPLDTSDPYFWELRVPELKFWAVLVVELERKEK